MFGAIGIGRSRRNRTAVVRRPTLEHLEGRNLLSPYVWPSWQFQTYTWPTYQYQPYTWPTWQYQPYTVSRIW